MARGTARASPAAPELPKVSFKKVEDDFSTPKNGVHDQQARSYGYNDFSDFQRPEYYIRHIEPLEIDLARQVEYDMDEQDKEWLDAVNTERKKEQVDKVSYEVFEIIMDRLEKEWFDLTKNIPKPDFAMPSEDSTCAICDDSEGENSNAIVFCDGCNLAVHQDCYGVPYIPEGQWLCRKCTVSPENPVSCILCPNEGGAFKQTVNGEWVHLLCAIWVPETRVANDVFMEPVTGVERISKQRWKLRCSICEIREGACIQCAKTSCFLAFHATCARKEKLLLPMKSTQAESVTLTCYCDKHLPKEQQDARAAALAAEEEEEEDEMHPSKLSKSARAYAKTYKPGPPLVPNIIVERISQYISKVVLRKKFEFLLLVCRYWSLKREARRGAPLLKRLHLEPWTATSANGKLQSEEERAMKLEQLRKLQQDLESVRDLTKLTWKRETRKLQQLEIIQDIFTRCLFPHEPPLRLAFERIIGLDKNDYFKNPVNKAEVPDYFDIISRPMCWTVIDERLDRHEYWDIRDFKDDIELVLDNATLYNKPGTPFYKTAVKIRNAAGPILKGLERLATSTQALPPPLSGGEVHEGEVKVEDPTPTPGPSALPSASPTGDLEPPLELLELLVSVDAVKDDIPLLLNTDPISSLFNYEFPVFKPPPPPPPPPPPKPRKGKAPKPRTEKGARAVGAEAGDEQFQIPPERTHRTRSLARAEASPISEIGNEDLGASTSSAARSLRSKKSTAEPLPSHPELLEDVDKQRSFKYFNAGWILPADQKRGGRIPAVDRPALPPPRKRMRVDRATSGLSVFSTAEEDNQTLEHNETYGNEGATGDGQASAPQSSGSDAASVGLRALSQAAVAAAADETMQIDMVQMTSEASDMPLEAHMDAQAGVSSDDAMRVEDEFYENPLSYLEEGRLPPTGVVIRANGKVIIEELDSPATRREKNQRRKAEKAKLKQASVAAITGPEASISTAAIDRGPVSLDSSSVVVVKKSDKPEAESDLSSLSEYEGARGKEEGTIVYTQPIAPAPSSVVKEVPAPLSAPTATPNADPGTINLGPGEELEGGTLVWAKADTFPWWPAVVFERDDPKIPKNVKKIADNAKKRKKKDVKMYFVRFFDKQQSWQYVDTNRLKMLGEDSALDEDLLAPSSRRQRWKNASIRNECREAFRKAQQEMETDGGDVEEEEVAGVESDAQIEPMQE